MESRPPREIDLPAEDPVFAELARIAASYSQHAQTLRLIGGVAVIVLARLGKRNRAFTTEDFDTVLRARDVRADKTEFARGIRALRSDLGYVKTDERGRLARCRFWHDELPFKLELICGDGIGVVTEPPRCRIVKNELYAAYNGWIERLGDDAWREVQARCGDSRFSMLMPGAAGMVLLKIRAVCDKLERVEQCRKVEQAHEFAQLLKHCDDLILMRAVTRELNETDELDRMARRDPGFRQQSALASGVLLAKYSRTGPPQLVDLVSKSPSLLLDALDI